MRADVRANDFPETTSRWHSLGREAGFGGVRELFVAPTDHFRMYCFSAVIDVRLRHHRHFVRDYLSNRRPFILTRLRGFKGFVTRKSLKIRADVQKVFTTKPRVASPEKLRSQVSGGSDSWRWLIG
jgi:hypothetical protein